MSDLLLPSDWTAVPTRETSDPARLCPAPRVSVLLLVHNHERYVAEALSGILAQAGGIAFEILVGDDASTDRSGAICRDWQARHADRIRLLQYDRNVGACRNFLRLLAAARGDYIALCDGDDHWIATAKLARQVRLMDDRPELALCGTRSQNKQFPFAVSRERYGLEDLLEHYIFQTSTLLFRASALPSVPADFCSVGLSYDSYLYILLAERGPCGFIDEVTSYYRRDPGGGWRDKPVMDKYREIRQFTDVVDGHFGGLQRRRLLKREFALCRDLCAARLSRLDGVDFASLRRIARSAWPRLRAAFPVRAAAWVLAVHGYPLAAAYYRLRRRAAIRTRLRRVRAAWNGLREGHPS